MAILIDIGGEPVNRAEQEMIGLLIEGLPPHYQLIPNIVLRRRGQQPYECDAIVVSPHAVYIIEIKGWSGTIDQITTNQWQLDSGRYVENPLSLNDQKAKVLAGLLDLLDLKDKNGQLLRRPYVQSCLLSQDPQTVFNLDPQLLPHCHTPKTIITYLCDPYRLDASIRDPHRYRHYLSQITRHITGSADGRQPADRTYGNYRITETTSIGDEVSTFLAHHAQLPDERLYRIRSWHLSPYLFSEEEREDRLEVLRRSAEALLKIGDHPNLVDFKDFGKQGSEFYEVTTWSDRGTLGTALSHGKISNLSSAARLRILIGLASGLEAAQKQGVYHRSLNPSVILLGPDYRPRIGDFDRAFVVDATRTVYGSHYRPDSRSDYVPPELAITDYEVFDNTDIYSLGIIAFELFTMMLPSMMANALRSERSQIPDKISDELIALIESMIAKDPAQRPANPIEVIDRLQTLLLILEPSSLPAQNEPPQLATPKTATIYEPTPKVKASLQSARKRIWTLQFVKELMTTRTPHVLLYQTLQAQIPSADALNDDEIEASFLSAEAAATALEEPLPFILSTLYDELLAPAPPLALHDLRTENKPLSLPPNALLLVLDGLTPFETKRICATLAKNRTPYHEYLWLTGATTPNAPERRAQNLQIAFDAPPTINFCQTLDEVHHHLREAADAIALTLPPGRRGDPGLPHLLKQRIAIIDELLSSALHKHGGDLFITSTYGAIYLGHGLRSNISEQTPLFAPLIADELPAIWSASFQRSQDTRVGSPTTHHQQPGLYPFRDMGAHRFPIARFALPDSEDAPRLKNGGLSIPERLLPLIHIKTN